ncbi:hypothetical protein QE152_g24272 [Popillia japonica]|uniref:Integrase zinc-binding domain-containing protein n=1 Tax=Popillia japonica TaxID=7064 RepID=A0AAW1KGA6_POPJA
MKSLPRQYFWWPGLDRKQLLEEVHGAHNGMVRMKSLPRQYFWWPGNTPHCVTGETPSKLMFSRKVKTRLDFLSQREAEKVRERQIKYHGGKRDVNFSVGQMVYVKDFRHVSKSRWTKAVIKQKLGRQTYLCIPMDDERLVWKRHVDQVIGIGSFYDNLAEPYSHGGIREVTDSTPEKVLDGVSDGLSALVGQEHTAGEGVLDSVMTDELGRDELTTCRESLRTPVVCSPNIKNRLRKQIRPPNRLNL